MKTKFNLNYYLEHPETKVVTRDGRDVTILDTCFVGLNGESIVAKTKSLDDKTDSIHIIYEDGNYFDDEDSEFDLFFETPTPKETRIPLTYEDLLRRIKDRKTMWVSLDNKMDTLLSICSFNCDDQFLFAGPICEYQGNYVLMECEYYFIDGTPCWKEIDGGSDNE